MGFSKRWNLTIYAFVLIILLNAIYGLTYDARTKVETLSNGLKQHKAEKLNDHNDPSVDISNEIRNVTIMYRIKSLFSLIPTRVAVSDEEAIFKKAKIEEELERREKELEGQEECHIKPMPPTLKSGLTKYVNKTINNDNDFLLKKLQSNQKIPLLRNRHNMASKLLRSRQNAASNARCNSKDYKSFSCNPKVEIERLGERFYPNHIIQEKCSECNKCMYGTGRCKQRSINIILYYDTDDDGIENLYKWDERKHTVYTGCRCLVTSDKTMIRILDQFCRQLGGDPVGDPLNCFRGNNQQTINDERWQIVP